MKRTILLIVLAAAGAVAREPDGTLGLIRTPNNGVPAIVAPGQSFDAVLRTRAALRLSGDASPELDVEWTDLSGGMAKARCTIGADAPPGTYALEAVATDATNGTDRNVRSVYLRESFPDNYIVAHITDTHIGSDQESERPPVDALRDVIVAANESGAAFALVTGDLTHNGRPEQFRAFLEVLDTCALPTFVCAGNHDRTGQNYENTFGPDTYLFWFGRDGYLSFDTKDFVTADGLGAQNADLELFRRAIKPARWAVGFTHRYEPNMGMQSQLVLFVDNPLDHLLFGHWHRANTEAEPCVPWGTTRITVTPAAFDGYLRLVDVSEKGVRSRPPECVVTAQ